MKHRKTSLVCLASFLLLMASGWAADEQDVTMTHDNARLAGTLSKSESGQGLVILHAGSGPTDRNGNQPGMGNDSLRLLAEGLVEAGWAVLRFDKRGVGASEMGLTEADLRPSHYINDLAAWVAWARDEGGFEAVYLLGHSEGALFAKAAAARADVNAVLSVAGAGRQAGILLLEQTEGRRPGEIDQQFRTILAELEAGRLVDEVPPVLAALFRPSVQPYLVEWLAMDPAALAGDLNVPLLVVSGSTDLQVVRADFEALEPRADRAAWIEGMNHVLREQDGPLEQQIASYLSSDKPLHDDLVPILVDFLNTLE